MVRTIEDIFIFEGGTGKTYLEGTSGDTVSYNNNEIPPLFRTPLKKSDVVTSIVGVPSGERTALIETGGEVYKLKGIIPTNRAYEEEGVPFGCMKESSCLSELNASQVMSDFGKKNGVESALEPVSYFRYGISFEGEPVCCPVQIVRGDNRLEIIHIKMLEIIEEAFRKNLRNKDKISSIKERFTSKIGNWIGFWYGSLERSNLCWGSIFFDLAYPQTNVGDHNVVLYPSDGGVAIGLVDLDKSHKNPGERVKDFELELIKKELALSDGLLYFLERGKKIETIHNYHIHQTASCINLNAFRKGFDPFHGTPLPNEDELEILKHFEDGRKGKIPEPIDKEFFTKTKEKIIGILK
ncbi:MAG: hypothetical protein GTN36_04185 [Candidatus Aenigmarchaeota archaeon]|nr:hypothetical protein [Candidatus Aenigmarchaeota archaeon]